MTQNKNDGIILALDSASTACSACITKDGHILSSMFINNKLTHSQTLLPSVEKVLSAASLTVADLNAVAVTTGPGSFTGVKIAVSTAKGLCFAYNTHCIELSSQEVLAYNLISADGIICTVMDARRNHFYNAVFRCHNGIISRLTEDRQISAEDLLKELKIFEESKPIYLTGDGTNLISDYFKGNSFHAVIPPNSLMYIKSESMATAIHAGVGKKVSAENLIPKYLRPPQAERELIAKQNIL